MILSLVGTVFHGRVFPRMRLFESIPSRSHECAEGLDILILLFIPGALFCVYWLVIGGRWLARAYVVPVEHDWSVRMYLARHVDLLSSTANLSRSSFSLGLFTCLPISRWLRRNIAVGLDDSQQPPSCMDVSVLRWQGRAEPEPARPHFMRNASPQQVDRVCWTCEGFCRVMLCTGLLCDRLERILLFWCGV